MADTIRIPLIPLNKFGQPIVASGIEKIEPQGITVDSDTIRVPLMPQGYASLILKVALVPYPIPVIEPDKTGGCAPLTVAFSASSGQYIESQKWEFGNGQTSGDASPTCEYTAGGDYTVRLTGSNLAGDKSVQADNLIQVLNPPIADFTSDYTSGSPPFNIGFTADCTGDITQYSWNFGDGVTSGLQNPSHIYTSQGAYDVGLIASNPYCSDEIVKGDYIQIASAWQSIFSDAYWEPAEFEGIERATWTGTSWAPIDHWEGIQLWLKVRTTWSSGFRPTQMRLTVTGGDVEWGQLTYDWGSQYGIADPPDWVINWRGDIAYLYLKLTSTAARLTNIEFLGG